jgi:hypothetical protein
MPCIEPRSGATQHRAAPAPPAHRERHATKDQPSGDHLVAGSPRITAAPAWIDFTIDW